MSDEVVPSHAPRNARPGGAGHGGCGLCRPVLDGEDIACTPEVLSPMLEADDMPTALECPFWDAAARPLGFTPRSLSPWAGLALALHDARAESAWDGK